MMFSQKLKKIMKEKGLTTYSIQKATGISQGNVDSWLKGRSKPRAVNLNRLCAFLDVPPEYFTENPPRDLNHSLHKRITKSRESGTARLDLRDHRHESGGKRPCAFGADR